MLDLGSSTVARPFGAEEPDVRRVHIPSDGVVEPVEAPRPLRIGLLNNMPDAALVATERQFRRAVGASATLRLFTLDGLPRGAAAEAHLAAGYAPHTALAAADLDALIVTGCEPRPGPLEDEAWFPDFAAVVDWAADHTVSTLFSCLGAHAAVLHRDGVARRPLPAKHWGVFDCAAQADHPLLAGMPRTVPVPHSRWNDLAEPDLLERGYTVLRRSDAVGVDLFVREARSLLVFLQGHPEYDADSLPREYRRDMGRFLDGTRAVCPPLPEATYTDEAARCHDAFAERARAGRDPGLMAAFPDLAAAPPRPALWHHAAGQLFANWLGQVAFRRAALDPHSVRGRA
ncbi:homoserine O-succinyltransferase [Methylobacterium sp. NEAU 140]|uniref:homoserine O-succinyltransferase MetA n=1 Tax=Methylobacterium sp. NEAU 140 TaxID=3064945 RepID=UPI002736FA0C|nr:homoserine O-succinyltransferase [Methylobacterium sp. NEAU 140]MDP4026067.1 homoserine O-succinyltransferase [Methylobacterium sp. NEAU 140]